MSWLIYSYGEVACFHPEFESVANQALCDLGLAEQYEWIHHLRTIGNTIVPDFVLRNKATERWVLAMEIKRTKESVSSSRTKSQAKSYAEQNQARYDSGSPKYFAVTNLELLELYALNGALPPNDCKIDGMSFDTGDFLSTPVVDHKNEFLSRLKEVVLLSVNEKAPKFENVWPRILSDWISSADSAHAATLSIPSISIAWKVNKALEDYFCPEIKADAARVFFLRCLLLEFLKGTLYKYGHAGASKIPPLTDDIPSSVVKAFQKLRRVDFERIFNADIIQSYSSITEKGLIQKLKDYISLINKPGGKVSEFAIQRANPYELVDSLFTYIHPIEAQNRRGKIQTDSELAAVLAHLVITDPVDYVLDPCCGEGTLLSAAYDRLTELGLDFEDALRACQGIEIDLISTQLATLRLALKEPKLVNPAATGFIARDDMFSQERKDMISRADVVLMNPPFKRYENQDGHQVPAEVRQHYAASIERLDGNQGETIGAQSNLYNYYIEYLTKAIKPGTRAGIILDNKWYNNRYGQGLKKLFLTHYDIKGVFEYPHNAFFKKWMIATSIIVAERVESPNLGNRVKFVRAKEDPRSVDLQALTRAFNDGEPWPMYWDCVEKDQNNLKADEGWKSFFSANLKNEFIGADWPNLIGLFAAMRSGRPDREGGGTIVYTFPLDQRDYGPRREYTPYKKSKYGLKAGDKLTPAQNHELRELASAIDPDFLGYAIRNSSDLGGYVLTVKDVTKTPVFEPPSLRGRAEYIEHSRKVPWKDHHDDAILEMYRSRSVRRYIRKIMRWVNLTRNLLPRKDLWFILREPAAGELILNRKLREGHRVHINPFALDEGGRQVRISSNFLSFGKCTATDDKVGLDRKKATYLIAAFLMSSFGQFQFEKEGQNREGLLAIEEHQVERIRVFDPRWVRSEKREAIIDAFKALPYPIKADLSSPDLPERNLLDELFADEIVFRNSSIDKIALLTEIHDELDDWITSRQP